MDIYVTWNTFEEEYKYHEVIHIRNTQLNVAVSDPSIAMIGESTILSYLSYGITKSPFPESKVTSSRLLLLCIY